MSDVERDAAAQAAEPTPLTAPREPVPPVVDNPEALAEFLRALLRGTGPVAVDAERAGGYRYSQRAYLVQFRREGAGTWLVDPVALPDLRQVTEALGDAEWVLHAANQDLPSLAEVGLVPPRVFDTELAGRLLGMPRVGLSTMVEELLGFSLAKDHSAADWSTRPLPDSWLVYAALDVELLLDLRRVLQQRLHDANREEWAAEEFEAVRTAPPPAPRQEPWRRVKGLRTRSPRTLAIVRELWTARDLMGRTEDITPSRLLPDMLLIAMADTPPSSIAEVRALPRGRQQTPQRSQVWLTALAKAEALPASELPAARPKSTDLPNVRAWDRIRPLAAARHTAVRANLDQLAEQLGLPRENLLSPRTMRALVWQFSEEDAAPPESAQVQLALAELGARRWQVDLCLIDIVEGLSAQVPVPLEAVDTPHVEP